MPMQLRPVMLALVAEPRAAGARHLFAVPTRLRSYHLRIARQAQTHLQVLHRLQLLAML